MVWELKRSEVGAFVHAKVLILYFYLTAASGFEFSTEHVFGNGAALRVAVAVQQVG